MKKIKWALVLVVLGCCLAAAVGCAPALGSPSDVRVDEEELALSFDQPLDSREDAMAFVRTCYPAECQERVLSMVEEGTASPYILRNRKMMSIFTIYGKEGR